MPQYEPRASPIGGILEVPSCGSKGLAGSPYEQDFAVDRNPCEGQTSILQRPLLKVAGGPRLADEEHIARLKSGVLAWNMWRQIVQIDSTLARPNLNGANLIRANLRGANLALANLSLTDLCSKSTLPLREAIDSKACPFAICKRAHSTGRRSRVITVSAR
jgi:hypothetical protein